MFKKVNPNPTLSLDRARVKPISLVFIVKKVVLSLLIWYKKYISRGENCRFIPSCSEYTYQAVEKYGVVKGLWLGVKRIIRCHPGGGSGIDLLQ